MTPNDLQIDDNLIESTLDQLRYCILLHILLTFVPDRLN
jgi:hypothetical protein